MVEKKAYPGTISSVILSVFVVIIMLLPFYTANHMEKIREGEGKYEFQEVMCFDISKKSEFEHDDYVWNPYGQIVCGSGAFEYGYKWYDIYSYQPMTMTMTSTPREGVVNPYGMSQIIYCPGQPPVGDFFGMQIFLTLTKEIIVENDVTSIVVFLDIEGFEYNNIRMHLHTHENGWSTGTPKLFEIFVNIPCIVRIDLTVDDLLKINNLGEGEKFHWYLDTAYADIEELPADGTNIYFDMQFYHIEEIKITTISWIGIAMAGGGVFMLFCSVLMLPHIEFSGVIGRIVGKRGD